MWWGVKLFDGYVDLKIGYQDGFDEYCVGYVWIEIEVGVNMQVWFGIGSDDGLKVWLNGELVCDCWQCCISWLDDDVVLFMLKVGVNWILLKVQNKMCYWSFIVCFCFC